MSVILEETDVLSALRILRTLFGVPVRDDAAAHAATQTLIQQLSQKVQTMSDALTSKLTQLQADVAAATTVNDSAVALINGFSTQLADLKAQLAAAGTPAAALALVDTLDASVKQNTAALAAAVPQNTPAAGTEPGGTPTPTPAAGADTTGGGTAGTTAPTGTGTAL